MITGSCSDYTTPFPTDLGYGKPGREREEDSGSDYATCATGSGIQIRVRHTTLSFICHLCLLQTLEFLGFRLWHRYVLLTGSFFCRQLFHSLSIFLSFCLSQFQLCLTLYGRRNNVRLNENSSSCLKKPPSIEIKGF